MFITSLARTALHPSRPLTVRRGFLQTYSAALHHDPSLADAEDVFKLVARTAMDVPTNSTSREDAIHIIGVFLRRNPDWADSTVVQVLMKRRYFEWENDAFDLLNKQRPELVEEVWQRKQKAREAALSESEPLPPTKHRRSAHPGAKAQPS